MTKIQDKWFHSATVQYSNLKNRNYHQKVGIIGSSHGFLGILKILIVQNVSYITQKLLKHVTSQNYTPILECA